MQRFLIMPTKSPPPNTLGKNIARLRTAKGWTQLELAMKLGHSQDNAGAYISRVESGETRPRLDTLSRFASALDVELKELIA